MRTRIERAKWLPIFILAVILMIIYNTLGNFSRVSAEVTRFFSVISPLFYGVLLSYFLYIPHRLFERLISKIRVNFISKRARLFSTLIVFLILVLLVAFMISFILPILFASIIDLINSIPEYLRLIFDFIDDLPADSIWNTLNIIDTVTETAGSMVNQVFNAALVEQLALGVINFAGELFNVLMGMFISLYMLLEREKIAGFFSKLADAMFKNKKTRARIQRYMQHINKVLFTFIASKGLDSVINLVVVTSILLIFDVPYAVLLGIIAGIFNFIPYLGSLIAVVLICLITVITGGFTKAIQVLIPLFIFQQLDGNFIEPRIMKSSLKISPILVIIAVVAGGAYFGIFGMFLAVPIAVIIKQILTDYISHSDHPEDPEQLEP